MKRQGRVIVGFLLVLLIVVFAVINIDDVPVNLGFTFFYAPLILVIIGSAIIGALIVFLTASTTLWQQKKQLKDLTRQVAEYKEKMDQKIAEGLEQQKRELRNQQAELEASNQTLPEKSDALVVDSTDKKDISKISTKANDKLDYFD